MKILNIMDGSYPKTTKMFETFYVLAGSDDIQKGSYIPLVKSIQDSKRLSAEYKLVLTNNGGNLLIPSTKCEGLVVRTNWDVKISNIGGLIDRGDLRVLSKCKSNDGCEQYLLMVNRDCIIKWKDNNEKIWSSEIDLLNRTISTTVL